MRVLSYILALTTLSVGGSAMADTISYSTPGTIAQTNVLTANTTGSIIGLFIGQDAGDTSVIRMIDVTSGYTSGYFFNNHATAAGTAANFGSVTAGDILVFELLDLNSGLTLATDPTHSVDGVNHGFEASFGGGTLNGVSGLAGGTFIGMEDLVNGDFDYNDNTFFFTNVSAIPAAHLPEPGTLALLGTGILGAAGFVRRRISDR
jgi:hypothetical protein